MPGTACPDLMMTGDWMFAVPVSLKKSKWLFFAALAAVAAAAVLLAAVTVRVLRDPPDTAVADGGASYSLRVENDSYSAFFSQLGLDADDKPCMERTVRIPAVFDTTYTAYNDLQKHAGLDLTPYRGLQAQQLTFPLHGGGARFAVLLVKGERVIGGHLTDGEYGSDMLPLL